MKAPAAILMSKGEVFSLLPPLGGHMVSVASAVKRCEKVKLECEVRMHAALGEEIL